MSICLYVYACSPSLRRAGWLRMSSTWFQAERYHYAIDEQLTSGIGSARVIDPANLNLPPCLDVDLEYIKYLCFG